MRGVSNRTVGAVLVIAGALLSSVHLRLIVGTGEQTAMTRALIGGIPLALSLVMTAIGGSLARERAFSSQFPGRMLAWTGAGVLALSAFGGWVFVTTLVAGAAPLTPALVWLDVATFGALVGLLVGIYDVRGLERQQSIERLSRINDTIRIVTQELVSRTERDDLERAVCDRLSDSDPYEGVWIGRYDAADATVRPAAWSGLDDEYVEHLAVTVDDTPTGAGAGGRAIKTREIQCVPDVFADPSMEPWWEEFERRGVTSIAVVPIDHGETVYGFVSIYADRRTVFGDHEQAVLAELGETIGHAIASIEARERLAEREAELARQNDRLDAFAGVVSHDLRNPLNVATGNLELAREKRTEDGDENLAEVADALAHMDDLIQDLLTLARQGDTVDESRPVSFRSVVERAWSTAGSSAAQLRTDDDYGPIVGDQDRVRQLLENLFRNSREHGGPNVTVTVRRTGAGFVVEDDGPGIPPDQREAVFEMGHTTNDDGTGFGLNIVRTIADAHGWDVSIEESPDGGASFEFSGVETVDSGTDDP